MAKMTNGYAFTYQVLGYLFFESGAKEISENIRNKYIKYLWNNGYSKFYNDLTKIERKFIAAMAKSNTLEKEDILAQTDFNPSNYSKYRRILITKGIIESDGYGKVNFVLPYFKEYINFVEDFNM